MAGQRNPKKGKKLFQRFTEAGEVYNRASSENKRRL